MTVVIEMVFRTLCRHLVLWNEITASKHWVEQSVSLIVLNYKERLFNELQKTNGDDEEEDLRMLQAAVDKQTIAQVNYFFNILPGMKRSFLSSMLLVMVINHQYDIS